MSGARKYEDLHALIDLLSPDQVRRVLRAVKDELAQTEHALHEEILRESDEADPA